MPTNVVRTAAQERLWKKAKARAAAQGHALDYAYTMGIYQRMLGEDASKALDAPVAPPFALGRYPGQLPRGPRAQALEEARAARQGEREALADTAMPTQEWTPEAGAARPVLRPEGVVANLPLDVADSSALRQEVDSLSAAADNELTFRRSWGAVLRGRGVTDSLLRRELETRGLALWKARAGKGRKMEPKLVIAVDGKLEKAVLYIGPRGGRWANPQHTIAWDDKTHGKPKVTVHDETEDEPKPAEPEQTQAGLPADEQEALDEVAEREGVEGMLFTKRRQGKALSPVTYGRATSARLGKLFLRGLISQKSPAEGEGFALTPAGEKLARRPEPAAPAAPVAPVAVAAGARTAMGELGKVANQTAAHVLATSPGAKRPGFILVGSYPVDLGYEREDGTPLTVEEAEKIAQVGPRPYMHIRTRVWPTAEAARAAVEAAGGRVVEGSGALAPAPVPAAEPFADKPRLSRAEVEAAAPPAPAGLTGQEIKAAPEGARITVRGKDGLQATLVKRGDAWSYETAAGPLGDYGTQAVLDILQGIREDGGESEPGWERMPENEKKPALVVAPPPALTVPTGSAKARATKAAPPQLGLFSSATTAKVQEARERAQQVAKQAAAAGKPVPQAALDMQTEALAELKDREVDAQAAAVARRVRGPEPVRPVVEIKAEAGEHVWGSRKDIASLVHSADDLAKLTPEEQSKVVTKARLVEPWEAEDLLAEGWEPQAVLARHAIEACIAPAAGDSLEARQAYMNGVDYWAHTFDACRTFQDVQEALVDLNRLTDGRVELAIIEKTELDTLLWKYAEHEAQRAGKTLAPRDQILALSTAYDAASSIYRDLHNTVRAQINEYQRGFWTEYTHGKRNPSSSDFWEHWVVKKPLPPELVAGQEKVAALEAVKKRAYQAFQDAGGDLIMRADESAAVAWANGLPSGDVSGMHLRAADGSYSAKFYKRDEKLAEAGGKVGGNQYQQMVAALGERMVRLVNSGQGGGGGWSSFSEKASPKAWLDVLEALKAMRKPKEKGGPAPTAEDHVQMMHEHLKSKKRGGGKGGPGWLRDVPDTVVRKGGRELGKSTPAEIAREFGLKNVQFGNWVSEDDAQVHVPAAHAAFADLQDLLGADSPGQVSMNGRLSLGIGARGSGNARAHYETQGEIINLTKISGGGALAHEWAHALDNLLSKAGNPESTQAHRFVSDGQDKGVDPVVTKAFHSAMQEILRGEFYQDSKVMGSSYWTRPHEMFARAFEAWAEDELARRGQENSYLVAGTKKVYQTRRFASQAAAAQGKAAQPYPQGAKRAVIGEKIGALVAALRETGTLKKALEALDARERRPRLLLSLEALEKAGGPYVGPKGGLWADPKHTIHWDPKVHGAGAGQGDLFGGKKPEPKLEVPAGEPGGDFKGKTWDAHAAAQGLPRWEFLARFVFRTLRRDGKKLGVDYKLEHSKKGWTVTGRTTGAVVIKNETAERLVELATHALRLPGVSGELQRADQWRAESLALDEAKRKSAPALTVPADQPAAALPPRTLDTMSDAIALGSPSGRQSQASQQAAQARLGEALFGPGGLKAPQQAQPSKAEALRRQAADLRKLAAQGVQPRKHNRVAMDLEAQAAQLAQPEDAGKVAQQKTQELRGEAATGFGAHIAPLLQELLAARGLPPLSATPTEADIIQATTGLWHGIQANHPGADAERALRANLHKVVEGVQHIYAQGDPARDDPARVMAGKPTFTPKEWSAMFRGQVRALRDLLNLERGAKLGREAAEAELAAKKSLALVVPADRLEKGSPRGGEYVKRAPRPGGGFRYYYSEKGYERATGHVDGGKARDQHLQGRLTGLLEKAGKQGLHPSRLADLVQRHGKKQVAAALKSAGCRFSKGRFYGGKA